MKKLVNEYSVAELDALLEITAYEQMSARERFTPEIDSESVKPVTILGFYPGLPEKIQCGRSGCRRHQKKGYLVLCNDDTETNIGDECGEKILGVSWVDITGGFANQWGQKRTLESVRTGVANAPGYLTRLRALIEQPLGVLWLLESIKSLDQLTPREILSELHVRASRSQDQVREPRRRTATELGIYDAAHGPPDAADEQTVRRYESREDRLFVTDDVGTFVGLGVFRFDGRARVFADLKPQLQRLASLDPNGIGWRERRTWQVWLKDVDARFTEIQSWLEDGLRFFGTDGNFALLRYLTRDKAINDRQAGLSWNFPTGGWRRAQARQTA
jgi:hypothetical protein